MKNKNINKNKNKTNKNKEKKMKMETKNNNNNNNKNKEKKQKLKKKKEKNNLSGKKTPSTGTYLIRPGVAEYRYLNQRHGDGISRWWPGIQVK